MEGNYFVHQDSIVRVIWGRRDTILFIFAGAAAEFALNKAVDWLYFTGRLPADPLKRLFSTVTYSKRIVFSESDQALRTIDEIFRIHSGVEEARKDKIPAWAYRDVLYMLIHYSIASFELLERKLTTAEKNEIYDVFLRLGLRMKLQDLPPSFEDWLDSREQHLSTDLAYSDYTADLFQQYKKHLGNFRYWLLIESQKLVVPSAVAAMLNFSSPSFFVAVIPLYKLSRFLHLDWLLMSPVLPKEYRQQVKDLTEKLV